MVNKARRSLMAGGLAGVATLGALGARASFGKPPVEVLSTYVADTASHDLPACARFLRVGDDLVLRRTTCNYAPWRVDVWAENGCYLLGRLPPVQSETIARLIDSGMLLTGKLSGLTTTGRPEIRVDVYAHV